MSLQVEKMEKNMAKLTIEVAAEDLEKAMQNAYQKAKGRISIPGFRKGKAPRKMIEQMYGKGVFLEDAVNALIPEHYSKALAECELEIVSQPTIDITQAEPGKAFIFTAEVAVKPEVTLGDYKGVEVPKTEITVTDEDVEAELKKEQEKNSRTISPAFENHVAFPDRVNTEFVEVIDEHTVKMRVWERGSGETLACGTGACAVAVASVLNGHVDGDSPVTVKLLGGDLQIFWNRQENLVYMTGPAATVFDGEIDVSFLK